VTPVQQGPQVPARGRTAHLRVRVWRALCRRAYCRRTWRHPAKGTACHTARADAPCSGAASRPDWPRSRATAGPGGAGTCWPGSPWRPISCPRW